ncbi:hypothetical protein BDA96_09G221300 [Sorghum bicolor]|uniref:Uncharacterized protein n=2 Tax=Sorghum bicolor TaxID=4558 RepID=A0A921QD93_SORBI|nr:hypothetical protein BDA96_09G221300 [Sorghum bicolor]OQU78344.1 hypothetical protein SORBI_3009G209650 [Sorghum bicolor]
MCPQLRTGGVEGLLVSTSFPGALELLSLLDHITTSQVLDLLLVHSEQPEPCPAIGASTSSSPFLPS